MYPYSPSFSLHDALPIFIPVLFVIRAFWEDAAVGNGTGRACIARYYLTRSLETRAVKAADAVAVICEGLRGDLIARGVDPAKIIVSPNGVDLDLFGDPPPRDAALAARIGLGDDDAVRSEEHTSELQSLMRISYAVFRLKKQTNTNR